MLSEIVKKQLEIVLTELIPLWLSEPTADLKKVVTLTGFGSFSVQTTTYRGTSSIISFNKKVEQIKSVRILDSVLKENQPEMLLNIMPRMSSVPQKTDNLVLFLCIYSAQIMESQFPIDKAIQQIISELSELLTTRKATYEVMATLRGLKLPEDIDSISLDEDIILRKLTAHEITEFSSKDILHDDNRNSDYDFVNTAICCQSVIPVSFIEFNQFPSNMDFSFHQKSQERIDKVLKTFHVLKIGKVAISNIFTCLLPSVLPGMAKQRSYPLVTNPFTFMELSHDDIEEFVTLYQKISLNNLESVQIATSRLRDAENRLSPIDSLLDAAIGLEVLLNPIDYGELAFRSALNYAFLGEEPDRRERFENMTKIQKTRNKIVHGGLSLSSKDSSTIHDNAELAKNCLRDCLKKFLINEDFNKEIDSNFWLERILSSNNKA